MSSSGPLRERSPVRLVCLWDGSQIRAKNDLTFWDIFRSQKGTSDEREGKSTDFCAVDRNVSFWPKADILIAPTSSLLA
jgi:hypothetical protein